MISLIFRRKAMSKDTPEVGDVWEDKDAKYRIYHIISVNNHSVIVADIHLWKSEFSIKVFKSFCTYLGKSKANIDDLFKTESEE